MNAIAAWFFAAAKRRPFERFGVAVTIDWDGTALAYHHPRSQVALGKLFDGLRDVHTREGLGSLDEFIVTHEHGPTVGAHSHFALILPDRRPSTLRRLETHIRDRIGAMGIPGAVRLRLIWDRGWLIYLLKHAVTPAVLTTALAPLRPREAGVIRKHVCPAPDGGDVKGRRVVVSHALGPKARAAWEATRGERARKNWQIEMPIASTPPATPATPAPPAPSPPVVTAPAAAPGQTVDRCREWNARVRWEPTSLGAVLAPPEAWDEAERRLRDWLGQPGAWGKDAAQITATSRQRWVDGVGMTAYVTIQFPRPMSAGLLDKLVRLAVEAVEPDAVAIRPAGLAPAPPDRPAPSPEPPAWRPAAPPAPSHTEPPSRPLPRPVAAFRPPGRHLHTLGALHPIHGPSGGLRARLARLGIRGGPRPPD